MPAFLSPLTVFFSSDSCAAPDNTYILHCLRFFLPSLKASESLTWSSCRSLGGTNLASLSAIHPQEGSVINPSIIIFFAHFPLTPVHKLQCRKTRCASFKVFFVGATSRGATLNTPHVSILITYAA
jgi:hypothetical protein